MGGNKARHGMLESTMQDLLDRRRINSTLRSLTLPKPGQIDFSSNDFLSLSNNPKLRSTYLAELQKTETGLASGGSRLLDGNSTYAEKLEQDIASFHGAEAGLLFNSGFDANAGFFACVPQPGDIVVYDELVHASVHDGMRLSRASSTISFPHNSVDGLRGVLVNLLQDAKGKQTENNIIVAVEAIYSMDGDVATLKQIVEVVEELLGDGKGQIVVDEAHATGVLGPQGRGLVCDLGLEDRIFARLHTFGKSLAGNGAIILGSHVLRQYLVNYARSLIYTTFLSYPCLALIRSSYGMVWSGETTLLQEHLHGLTQALYNALQHLHKTSSASRQLLNIPSACPKSPIFSVQLEQPRQLANYLQDRGMMVRAVVPPTVPLGTQRIRICLHAGNSMEQVKKLVQTLSEWLEASKQLKDNEIKRRITLEARL
ncbi:8-amino-7-oxononanoate synthase-like protein [Phaeosphaeriaceae sp. PMI808]|nr:8-amino-7-oxononanoate synthase-like protein [Phaeosphaeriaceae sp. PMI808]